MAERDPRIHPQPGDEIKQSSGRRVRVTSVEGDCVSWAHGFAYVDQRNSWSLEGWRKGVAASSTVTKVAHTGTPDHG